LSVQEYELEEINTNFLFITNSQSIEVSSFSTADYADRGDRPFLDIFRALQSLAKKAPNLITARLGQSAQPMAVPIAFDSRDQELLKNLSTIDTRPILEQNAARLSEGTGSWMLGNTEFTEWLNKPISQVLWLHGDPGTGKTVITTSLTRELTAILELRDKSIRQNGQGPEPKENILVYFFCSITDRRRRSALAILSNLLYQIIQQRPDLIGPLRAKYDQKGSNKDWFSSKERLRELWGVFRETLQQGSFENIYFIIDALDECDGSRVDLLTLLQSYIRSQKESRNVRFLVTSRNDEDILNPLSMDLDISMELSSKPQDDIRRYADFCLSSLRTEDGEVKSELKRRILEKSQGNILWVSLFVKTLRRSSTTEDVSSALSEAPTQTEVFYQQMWNKVVRGESRDAWNLLAFMTVARQPLTYDELSIVAAKMSPSLFQTVEQTLRDTGSFLTIMDGRIWFIHQRAQDFIRNYIQEKEMDLKPIHAESSRASFEYISNPSIWTEPPGHLHYPVGYWIDHAKKK
jgi:NACHT domain